MPKQSIIALFGEAEKGDYHRPYYFSALEQLADTLGEPPPETTGLFYAIQALLYQHPLFYIRVREEGFSLGDYNRGLYTLEKEELMPKLDALCLPGVGDRTLMRSLLEVCVIYHQVLITNEADLYDYLTA